jgi:lipid II:glycine glycyltransferase (peptidoglycan interpeptide bridge formation enzyme)
LVAAIWKSGYARVHIADYFRELGLEDDASSRAYETLVVDISPADWQPPDAKLQSEIRKAEREGVVVSTFSSQHHLDRFMDLMIRTERRHQRQPKYSREFFRRLAELATSDTRIKWLWVEQNGAPVVSHMYFVEGTMALNWQIYYDKEFSSLKANQHVMYTTARSLAASGVKLLNLGATPPEADSVRAYKEKWGGVVYTYPISTRRSWLGRLL